MAGEISAVVGRKNYCQNLNAGIYSVSSLAPY
jgi:hypothetical protein